jgi:hypothetical protein
MFQESSEYKSSFKNIHEHSLMYILIPIILLHDFSHPGDTIVLVKSCKIRGPLCKRILDHLNSIRFPYISTKSPSFIISPSYYGKVWRASFTTDSFGATDIFMSCIGSFPITSRCDSLSWFGYLWNKAYIIFADNMVRYENSSTHVQHVVR